VASTFPHNAGTYSVHNQSTVAVNFQSAEKVDAEVVSPCALLLSVSSRLDYTLPLTINTTRGYLCGVFGTQNKGMKILGDSWHGLVKSAAKNGVFGRNSRKSY
jgi:hypothetical protein